MTDAGVVHVSRLRQLESLALDGTDVSDKSIPLGLRLRGTRISDEGIAELRNRWPLLKVVQ